LGKGDDNLRDTALAYLQNHNVVTLATSDGKQPWAAAVFYVSDGFDLYFLSRPESVHGRYLAANPHLAATVTENYRLEGLGDWRDIKGIQLEGEVEMLVSEDEIGPAVEKYAAKYPFTAPYLKVLTTFPRALALLERIIRRLEFVPDFDATEENRLYRLTPTRLWWMDNAASFEQRREVSLQG
jgi:uncharacterized protein